MATVIDVTERPVFKLGPDTFRIAYPDGVASGGLAGSAQVNASVNVPGVGLAATLGTPSTVAFIQATGIVASGQVGSVIVDEADNIAEPFGIASVVTLGTAKTVAGAEPDGLSRSGAVGDARAFTLLSPVGIDASGNSGTPRLSMVMAPGGIASAEAFGDADTLATVFVIPGPLDPSNDFGNATATKKGWIFRPPVNTYKWRLFKEYEGISLIKENGVWSEVPHPDLPRTKSAEKYLAGGRDHVVGDALKAELEGLGYSVTEEFVTTEEYL